MVALVAARLRMLHIVLYRYDGQIILPANHLSKPVYIRCERAHDSDARYVLYICDHILYGALVATLFELLNYAFRSLDTRLYVLYRIVIMYVNKLVI